MAFVCYIARPFYEEAIMYLHTPRSQKRDRNRSSRYTAKLKAKNRRRVNRMQGRKLGGRLSNPKK